MPAFEPNPTNASTNTTDFAQPGNTAARNASNDSPPAFDANTTRARRIATRPACVIAAYHTPAVRTAGRSRCSASTSTNDVSAINSHSTRNVVTLPAKGTHTIAATNNGSIACDVREPAPWSSPLV